MVDCGLNAKNHRSVYKTDIVPTDQNQSTNYRSNGYSRGGYSGRGRFNGWGGYNQIDSKIIHPEGLDAGVVIKMATLVKNVHTRTKLT